MSVINPSRLDNDKGGFVTLAELFEVLYWIAIVGMSVALAAITVLIFVMGFKFIKDKRRVLGAGCIVFSLVAAGMIVLMLNDTFFFPV